MYQGLLDDYEPSIEKYTENDEEHMPSFSAYKDIGESDDFDTPENSFDEYDEYGYESDDVTEESVALKEKEVAELRDSIKDLQERFVWDLSLAIKRKLCNEKGQATPEAISISSVSISSIVESIEKEKPNPKNWVNWITQKLARSA